MRWILPVVALGTLGCSGILSALDTTPARVEVAALSGPLWDKQIHPVRTKVVTESGKELPEELGKLSWSSTPVGIVDISGAGVRCLSSGDASVIVTGAGLSQTFTVQCRIVAKLKVSKSVDLLLGEPDAGFTAVALDAAGKAMPDVEVRLSSSSPTIVDAKPGRLTPRSVGTATVTASAGDVSAETAVTVIERIKTDTLALSDGETIAFTLSRGRYRVGIQTRSSDGAAYGVTVTSTSGGCPSRGEAANHEFTCEVGDTTSLVITNPTTFGMGPPQMGNISVYRIP